MPRRKGIRLDLQRAEGMALHEGGMYDLVGGASSRNLEKGVQGNNVPRGT